MSLPTAHRTNPAEDFTGTNTLSLKESLPGLLKDGRRCASLIYSKLRHFSLWPRVAWLLHATHYTDNLRHSHMRTEIKIEVIIQSKLQYIIRRLQNAEDRSPKWDWEQGRPLIHASKKPTDVTSDSSHCWKSDTAGKVTKLVRCVRFFAKHIQGISSRHSSWGRKSTI